MIDMPMTQLGIGGLGPWELILIFLVVLIVFGAGKLPSIGSSLGQAIKNFKGSLKGREDKDKESKEPKNG